MNPKQRSMAALVLVAAAVAGLATGCGSAEARPLQVTYYYLPG